jgi:hypothetical protein
MPQKGDRIVLDGKAYVTNAAKESQGKVLIDLEEPRSLRQTIGWLASGLCGILHMDF